jgi:hypothetical protein
MISQTINAVSLALIKAPRPSPIFRESLNSFDLVGGKSANSPLRIPNVITGPVRPSVPSGLRINAMSDTFYEGAFASISNDCLKDGGRFLPIRSVLLRIPIAAFGLKKYF